MRQTDRTIEDIQMIFDGCTSCLDRGLDNSTYVDTSCRWIIYTRGTVDLCFVAEVIERIIVSSLEKAEAVAMEFICSNEPLAEVCNSSSDSMIHIISLRGCITINTVVS